VCVCVCVRIINCAVKTIASLTFKIRTSGNN